MLNDINRQVAELLGWTLIGGVYFKGNTPFMSFTAYSPSTDANQAFDAVREWLHKGDPDLWDGLRLTAFGKAMKAGDYTPVLMALLIAKLTPKRLCKALIAAAKEVQ